ncbi:TPA: hypothetical protein NPO60_000450 [Klebsiella quasipneumoniae subsp. similipneumoniae]|nr:hypothetical protein [Klebsiella quasipneumoniae subsp. similipneumoniae]HCI6289096.1 hypothetical protein [Klebsiella quasipneumoniae subsp. similipneumoniae]HDZ1179449.1 hypothetical protein [Klebsiella pneumoniae]
MKSLSSSRREVLVDCFHVYTYYIGYLLPRSARTQHPAASLHYFFNHSPAKPSSTHRRSRCKLPNVSYFAFCYLNARIKEAIKIAIDASEAKVA